MVVDQMIHNMVLYVFQEYWGNIMFPIIFSIGIIITFVFTRKRASIVFLLETVFLFLTVYNPWLVNPILEKTGFQNEYYRLFWILPIIPGVAYYGTRLLFSLNKGFERMLFLIALIAVISLFGEPLELISDGNFVMADNIYKVPDELIYVADFLHTYTDQAEIRVLLDKDLNNDARQYDPSLIPAVHRAASIYYSGIRTQGELDESTLWYQKQKAFLDTIWNEVPPDIETFQWAMQEEEITFVVVERESTVLEFLVSAGCIKIGETEQHLIYRWEMPVNEEPEG